MFHKNLGIKNLISIEKDEHNSSRFKFNVPFSCIRMEFANSNDILPNIDWEIGPSILWLDYDDKLNSNMFKDLQTFVANALPGSLFLISVNAHPFDSENLPLDQLKEFRLNKLIENVGDERVSSALDGSELGLGGLSKVYTEMINEEIYSIIRTRNNGKSDEDPDKLLYKQLINFTYKDGAKMVTLGGIIYSKSQEDNMNSASFTDLDFYREGDESFNISIPSLTYRELHKLDSLLPSNLNLDTGEIVNTDSETAQNISDIIPLSDVVKYSKIYRYFPAFTESIL